MAYLGVSPSNGVRKVHTYTATSSQTTFSGAGAENISLSYRDSTYIDVYQNGVKLADADYTATSGTSVVLGTGASANDMVVVVVYDVFSVADTVSKADGGQFDGNVTMGGTLGVTGATTLTGDLSVDTNVLKVDTSNNRVGFNITSPSNKVHTHQTTSGGNFIQITNSTTGTTSSDGFIVGIDSGENANLWNYENEDMVFATNNSEKLRLTSDGKLGIATSSPSSTVEIAGALAVGSGCTASGTAGSMAVGHASSATGARSFVFGREMTVSGDHSFGIALSDQNGLDLTADNTMAIMGGKVGIGTSTDTEGRLNVFTNDDTGYAAMFQNDGNNSNRKGILIKSGYDSAGGTNKSIDIADGNGDIQGQITFSNGTVTYGAFTAFHHCIIPNSDNDSNSPDNAYPYGTLLEITSITYTQKNSVNTERGIRYNVQKSSSAKSKSLLGAYGSSMNDESNDNLHQALVLGDGHILCNNENGNIEIGDYICSSSKTGEGMKATSICNTIGIAREAITFSNSTAVLVAVEYGYRQFVPEDLEARITALEGA